MPKIHPSAIVADGAILDDSVEVGPFCYVGPHVTIGAGTRLIGHCNIDGYTTLGSGNVVHPFAALGQPAQDHAVVPGAKTYLKIGNDNIFREGCAIHTGTKPDSETVIGNHCMFMNTTHVAHNCRIGNNVIFVGFSGCAGYCEVFDNVLLSALSGMHQFCRIGSIAMLGARTIVRQDVPPYCMLAENSCICGPNAIGLRRNGFDGPRRLAIRKAIKEVFFRGLNTANALAAIEAGPVTPDVEHFVDFIRHSDRGIMPGDPELIALGTHLDGPEE